MGTGLEGRDVGASQGPREAPPWQMPSSETASPTPTAAPAPPCAPSLATLSLQEPKGVWLWVAFWSLYHPGMAAPQMSPDILRPRVAQLLSLGLSFPIPLDSLLAKTPCGRCAPLSPIAP